jgi:MFS family permease
MRTIARNTVTVDRFPIGATKVFRKAAALSLSATLLALALLASAVVARLGLRNALTIGMGSITIASAVIGAVVAERSLVLLSIGFLVMGAGLAVPYASAPRLALSALSPAQTGQGSGIVNACTFLGGSVGVAGGAIASALGGFGAVLMMVALAGIIGTALSRRIPKTE